MSISRVGSRWSGAAAFICCMTLAMAWTQIASADPSERIASFGPDGTAGSSFTRVGSVAVDEGAASVYVLDSSAGALFRFGAAGEPNDFTGVSPSISGNRIEGLDPFDPTDSGSVSSQVAVDSESGVFYVTEKQAVRAFLSSGEAAEFTEGPGAGTSEIPGFGELYGVAIDASGNIYAADHSGSISVFSPSGAPITSFSAPGPRTIAVGPSGNVYAIADTQSEVMVFAPSEFPPTSTTTYSPGQPIDRKLNSVFIVGVAADPADGNVYLLESSFSLGAYIRILDTAGSEIETIGEPGAPDEEEAVGGGSEGIAALGSEIELGENETAKFYTADSELSGDSRVAIFGTKIVVAPPTISALRSTSLTADSAVLRASITPNTRATTYRFEYGLGDCSVNVCTSVPVGGAAIGDGTKPVAVSQAVTGLIPATTYHYRLVAVNELGEGEESGTFSTQPLGGGAATSDGRAWEMVSSPDKGGGSLVGTSVGLIQAAASGRSIAYLSRGATEPDPEGNRSIEVSAILGKRGPGGWSSRDITPPNSRTVPIAVGQKGEYLLFDPELSSALVEPHDGTNLSPLATERTPYLRQITEPPSYQPLVTGKEGVANVPPGTVFGGNPLFGVGSVSVNGANASLDDVVLTSVVPLAEGAPPPPAQTMYHWHGGQLDPLSVLPVSKGGEFVAASLLGSGSGSRQNAISANGSRIFWQTGDYNANVSPTALYLRDTAAGETVRLDVVQDGSGIEAPGPEFQGADADGTTVIFRDRRQLTSDASPSGVDLYRCELPEGDASGGCASLTDITGATQSDGESAEVIGLVSGMSSDATTVYFAARGVLDDDPNGPGDSAEQGEPNLYIWKEGVGIRFIATLSDEDNPDWGGPARWTSARSTATSPGGRYLAFMSSSSLTGQPNLDAETGEKVQDAFAYDAVEDQLSCVSCSPLGSAPSGAVSQGFDQLVDPNGQWEGERVAAILPQPTIIREAGGSVYQSRASLDNGRVFFNSLEGLVPVDTNHQWDVYQFEPFGLGDCTTASGGKSVVRSPAGCISLISSGTAEGEAVFMDASRSGDDVFFYTPAQLSVLDKDQELDAYDARVGGVEAVIEPVSECAGDACQAPAAPPIDPTPGSASFRGPGNVKGVKCPKGKRKVKKAGKTRCVAKKKNSKHKKGKKQQGKGKGGNR